MCPSSHRGAVAARVAKVLLQRTCKKGAAASTVGFRAPADHAKPRPTRTRTRHRWTSLTIPIPNVGYPAVGRRIRARDVHWRGYLFIQRDWPRH